MRIGRQLAWVLVLVVGVVLYLQVRRTLVDTQNPNLLPALILLGASVVPAAFTTFVYGRDLGATVSTGAVTLTALVGGVVGIVLAGLWEYRALTRYGVVPLTAVGLSEEAAKLAVPLAVLLLSRRYAASPANGLLLGVASGAGFAALETMGYAFVTLVQSQGDLRTVEGVLLVRGLLSPAAHMTWTGLTAAALWQAAEHRWHPASVLRFGVVFVVAVALHAAWDAVDTDTGYGVVAGVSLFLLVLTAHQVSRESHALVLGRRAPVAARTG